MKNILNCIKSQLNLLLSLVNDVLDINMINHGKFSAKLEKFCPQDTFDFIVAMFKPQSNLINSIITYQMVSVQDF